MSDKSAWPRVTKAAPCLACGKDHFCTRSADGRALHCMRTVEAPPGWRLLKRCPDGGVVFVQANGHAPALVRSKGSKPPPLPPVDRGPEATRYEAALTPDLARELADVLGIPVDVLGEIGVGWTDGHRFTTKGTRPAWTFPEVDPAGRVVGITFRDRDGQKIVGALHKRGLIVPRNLATLPDPVLIVEGASDVLAALSMGLAAVGRPSASAGADLLAELLRDRDVLLVGENDEKPDGRWPGRDGARHVAAAIARAWGKPVAWSITPAPAKDLREWWIDTTDTDATAAGKRFLGLVRTAAVPASPLPPAPRAPSVPQSPPPLPGTPEAAEALKREIHEALHAEVNGGLRGCALLAQFTDAGYFELLGLTYVDRYGRTQRSYSYFSTPHALSPRRIRQKIEVGRVWNMSERFFRDVVTSEDAIRCLSPLKDEPEELEAACLKVVEFARAEARDKQKDQVRVGARLIRSVLPTATPTKTIAKSLWDAAHRWRKRLLNTTDVPMAVTAAIDELYNAARDWDLTPGQGYAGAAGRDALAAPACPRAACSDSAP